MHEDLIFHAAGRIGGQPRAFGRIKGGNALDEPDGTNGDQILLIGGLGVVLLVGVRLAEIF